MTLEQLILMVLVAVVGASVTFQLREASRLNNEEKEKIKEREREKAQERAYQSRERTREKIECEMRREEQRIKHLDNFPGRKWKEFFHWR